METHAGKPHQLTPVGAAGRGVRGHIARLISRISRRGSKPRELRRPGNSRRVRTKAVEVYGHPSERHVAYAVSVMADYVGAGALRLFNPAAPQA